MTAGTKTIKEINARLKKGAAVVMTAMEFKEEVRNGYKFKVADVDVVTTATRSIMSGTSAMLVVPVAKKGTFKRAHKMWLNGVPCFPGSSPGEGSGMVDTVIYGTQESRDYEGSYGGGHLLREIVEEKEIQVECLTAEGRTLHSVFSLDQLKFARMYSFRNDFQNYSAFANIKNLKSYRENPASIFACRPLPQLKGLTMSGSGELNPLENDPNARVFRAGMKILVNKVPGIVIGFGTRSNPQVRSLSIATDMHGMDPEFMGGFKTSYGVEVTNGIAVPFPVLNQGILDDLAQCLDENIPLRLADIGDRIPLVDLNYADVWSGARLEVEFDPDRCVYCSFQCPAEYFCPMAAISWKDKEIDASRCFGCGACTSNCPGGAFMGKGDSPRGRIGLVHVLDTDIPVVFRQSNRYRSQILAQYLKELMLEGDFLLNDSDLELTHWHT